MTHRRITVTLAAGAILALASPAARAQVLQGDRTLPVAGSSAVSKKAAEQKLTRQYLKRFHKVHGAGAVAPTGVGVITWQITRPYEPAVIVLPSGSSGLSQVTCYTDENGNGCSDSSESAAAPATAGTTDAAGS